MRGKDVTSILSGNHSVVRLTRPIRQRKKELIRKPIQTTEMSYSTCRRIQKCIYGLYVCIFGFKGASTSKVIGALNEMMKDDYDDQMIFGDLMGLKLPDIRLTGEENPEKTSPRKFVPTGDRTRARCVTSAHATTCATAVDAYMEF